MAKVWVCGQAQQGPKKEGASAHKEGLCGGGGGGGGGGARKVMSYRRRHKAATQGMPCGRHLVQPKKQGFLQLFSRKIRK